MRGEKEKDVNKEGSCIQEKNMRKASKIHVEGRMGLKRSPGWQLEWRGRKKTGDKDEEKPIWAQLHLYQTLCGSVLMTGSQFLSLGISGLQS